MVIWYFHTTAAELLGDGGQIAPLEDMQILVPRFDFPPSSAHCKFKISPEPETFLKFQPGVVLNFCCCFLQISDKIQRPVWKPHSIA